jgi:hypothetical protein
MSTSRCHNPKVHRIDPAVPAEFWHHAHQVFLAQASAAPEIPAKQIARESSQFYIASSGRLLRPAFPAGYSHCRGVQALAENRLAEI